MAGIAGDAHTPIYGYQWRAYFTTFNSSGAPTAVTSPDSEISLDGGTFADCTNEATPIKEVGGATDSPNAYLDLTAAEMACGCAHVQIKSSATAMQPIIIYPRVLPVWATGTAQGGGSITTIKLAAGAPAYDISGCWVGVDSGMYAGQVRKIASYDPVTKIATVKRAFGGAPDGATYSLLVPEAMQGALVTRAMLALPAFAAAAAGGLPTVDVNNFVAGVLALGVQAKLDVGGAVLDEAKGAHTGHVASIPTTSPLDAAGVRSAIGMATANLDTQLAGLPTDQDVRDAMMRAPTAGTPATGSVDKHLDDLLTNLGVVDTVVDAIKAKTDLLDTADFTVISGLDGDKITLYHGATFDETVTGLTISADWAKVLLTIKGEDGDADASALVQVQESNPGVAADGLIRLAGAAPGAGEDAWAELVVAAGGYSGGAGSVRMILHQSATVALWPRAVRWDLKEFTADSPAEGNLLVVSSPGEVRFSTTRATA